MYGHIQYMTEITRQILFTGKLAIITSLYGIPMKKPKYYLYHMKRLADVEINSMQP